MEISLTEVMAIFQEDEFSKSYDEILLERGACFVDTLICEIPYLSEEDSLWHEAVHIGGL